MAEDTTRIGGEIMIGMIGATGSGLHGVANRIKQQFQAISREGTSYRGDRIHVIEELHEIDHDDFVAVPEEPFEERALAHMDAGDDLRRRMGRNDAVALNAINTAIRIGLRQQRNKADGKDGEDLDAPRDNTVYILDSLKHPEEVALLRSLYGNSFYAVACYASEVERRSELRQAILASHEVEPEHIEEIISKIVQRDEADEANKHGQHVRDAFQMADFFVDVSDDARLDKALERFVEMLFGYPYYTPRNDEYGMFHAKAAALRSADLSRQVGAVITDVAGDILAVGTNEVPKAGGGIYGCEDAQDHRDFQVGHDSTSQWRREIVHEAISVLKDAGWFDSKVGARKEEDLAREGVRLLKENGSRITNIIEFVRPVHAEMGALMDAARRGVSVRGTTLYCTTFPCHECARLIIAAGIIRVVYIEPYPKSAAEQLYGDSIAVAPSTEFLAQRAGSSTPKVLFQPFVGLAPRLYFRFFDASDLRRKDRRGMAIRREEMIPKLRFEEHPIYIEEEKRTCAEFKKRLTGLGLHYRSKRTKKEEGAEKECKKTQGRSENG